jgi:uncharacterized protein (DUF2147 family)
MKAILGGMAMILWAGVAMAADPAEGVWQTKPDDNGNFGHIEIKPCGPALCGTLIQSFDGAGAVLESDNVGKRIVWDMVAVGDGTYVDGQVWAPDRDKTYNAKMALAGSTLSVSGCVLGGLICRASDWTRVK